MTATSRSSRRRTRCSSSAPQAKDPKTLELRWQIDAGLLPVPPEVPSRQRQPGRALGPPDFPQGEIKNDQYLGTSEIYTQDMDVLIPVTISDSATKFKLTATYQGCAEAGFCYPPITKTVALDIGRRRAAIRALHRRDQPGAAPVRNRTGWRPW